MPSLVVSLDGQPAGFVASQHLAKVTCAGGRSIRIMFVREMTTSTGSVEFSMQRWSKFVGYIKTVLEDDGLVLHIL